MSYFRLLLIVDVPADVPILSARIVPIMQQMYPYLLMSLLREVGGISAYSFNSLCYLPGGRLCAGGYRDKHIRLWAPGIAEKANKSHHKGIGNESVSFQAVRRFLEDPSS